jgi:hypothetical protein
VAAAVASAAFTNGAAASKAAAVRMNLEIFFMIGLG